MAGFYRTLPAADLGGPAALESEGMLLRVVTYDIHRYPPPAQVAGVLLGAIFLDLLDTDALRLQQLNELLENLPEHAREGLRRIEILVLRPSQDLGRIANDFEADLPRAFRFLVRGLGSREARSNDMLSLVMFQHDYIQRLIDLGERDAEARAEDIDRFLGSRQE